MSFGYRLGVAPPKSVAANRYCQFRFDLIGWSRLVMRDNLVHVLFKKCFSSHNMRMLVLSWRLHYLAGVGLIEQVQPILCFCMGVSRVNLCDVIASASLNEMKRSASTRKTNRLER